MTDGVLSRRIRRSRVDPSVSLTVEVRSAGPGAYRLGYVLAGPEVILVTSRPSGDADAEDPAVWRELAGEYRYLLRALHARPPEPTSIPAPRERRA